MDSPVSHRSIELNIDPGLNAANDAAHFDAIIRDTERSCVTTYDSSCRKRFEKPSIGLKIGHALIKCTRLKRKQAIVAANEAAEKDVDQFLALH